MRIHNFRPLRGNLSKGGPLNLLLITVFFLSSQPAQALAEEYRNTKRDEAALIGKTTLQELVMKHPNVSQAVKQSDGTSVIYAYSNTLDAFPQIIHTKIRGANAIEFNFDKNQILLTINLIEFNVPEKP